MNVQTIPLSEAKCCLDCSAISDTKTICQVCGGSSFWRLDRWIKNSTAAAA